MRALREEPMLTQSMVNSCSVTMLYFTTQPSKKGWGWGGGRRGGVGVGGGEQIG